MDWIHLSLFWLAAVTLLGIASTCLEFVVGHRKIKILRDLPPLEGADAPKVSVIAAARNEERNVEEAARSLLSFDYPDYEVILVNDRSADRTGEILDRLTAETNGGIGVPLVLSDNENFPKLEGRAKPVLSPEGSRPMHQLGHDGACPSTARNFGDFSRNGEFLSDNKPNAQAGTPLPPSQKLRVVHIKELPAGWLGKNSALQMGADAASGKFLLFTDADVVMEPSTLSRAVRYMEETKTDHLAAGPNVKVKGAMLNIFCGGFAVLFAIFIKPWKVSNPSSGAHIGIGAFNLIRADVYRQMGGHRAIAMRVDDDLKLGKLVKKHGFRQNAVAGRGMVFVEWYSSVGDAVRGLTKNMFAGLEYSVAMVVGATLAMLAFLVFPYIGAIVTGGWTQLLFALAAVALWTLACAVAHQNGIRWFYGLGFPLATLMFLFILWRSMLVTLKNDGVNWRGTHYPLKELKANKV